MFREVPQPPRPAVPAAFLAMAASVAAIRACLWLRAGPDEAALPCACLLAAAAGLFLWTRLWPRGARGGAALVASALCFSVAAAALVGSLCAQRIGACAQDLGSSAVSAWSFTLEGDMALSGDSWRGRAKATRDGAAAASVWLVSPSRVPRGWSVGGVGRFKACGDDDWGRSSFSQGVCGTVTLLRAKAAEAPGGAWGRLLSLREKTVASLCPYGEATAGGAVLTGLVCGSSTGSKELGLDDAFAACGASHLMAVSGSHLCVVASVFSAALSRARLGRRWRLALLLAATGVFVAFTGAAPSAVRSWVMSVAATGSELAGRRGHSLSAVSVAGLCMALAQPEVCGQLGFLLSVSCVCGICLFGGFAKHVVIVALGPPSAPRRLPARLGAAVAGGKRFCWDCLALGFVCQLASLPLAAPAFGKVAVAGALSQVPLSALFTPVLAAGLIGVAAGPVPVAGGLIRAAALGAATAFARLVEAFASLPFSCVAVDVPAGGLWAAVIAAAAALLVFWPRVTRGGLLACGAVACAACAAYLIRWRFFAPARVCVMDVGQADAILVTDGASSLMVDAGVDGAVARALARNHVLHLDAVLLTHFDEDHVGGLDDLAGVVDVGRVYVAQGAAGAMGDELAGCVERLCGEGPVEVSYGDVICAGGFSARVVWPRAPVDGQGNASSVMLSVAYDAGDGRSLRALLTGDAEKDETAQVIAAGDAGDIDLLKVGHHGSAVSITAEEAALLRPEVSVASAGENNRYGHPRRECVVALESAGSLFLCTKDAGDVTVEPGEKGPAVSCSGGDLPLS